MDIKQEILKDFDDNWIKPWKDNNFGVPNAHFTIRDFLSQAIDRVERKTLDLIAEDQGWEESRDIYADALGLPLKYPKLMEEYKIRNKIKGRIKLDSQSLSPNR